VSIHGAIEIVLKIAWIRFLFPINDISLLADLSDSFSFCVLQEKNKKNDKFTQEVNIGKMEFGIFDLFLNY